MSRRFPKLSRRCKTDLLPGGIWLKLSTNKYTLRFLLASLNVEAILQEPTIRRRREEFRVMANGLSLEDAYGATLGRIRAQGGERLRPGMATLMCIGHSERPLKADELVAPRELE